VATKMSDGRWLLSWNINAVIIHCIGTIVRLQSGPRGHSKNVTPPGRGEQGRRVLLPLPIGSGSGGGKEGRRQGEELGLGRPGTSFSTLSTAHSFAYQEQESSPEEPTRSQAVARIADRTAKNCRGHVT